MKTYVEAQGHTAFDWNAFLNRDDITEQEWRDAQVRSMSWVTCACGNLCDAIPRFPSGIPEDPRLSELGSKFAGVVAMRDVAGCKYTLEQIEIRSGQLLINEGVLQNEEHEQ